MKKIKIIIMLILSLSLSIIPVYASTNTNVRTESNYLIQDWITVTEYNKYDILTTPAVDATEKIYDFADLYSDEEEQKLYDEVTSYIEDSNMDLAIVTIDENNKTPQSYADDFYDYNNFDHNGGVLFLIDMDNRKIWMSTTGTAIRMYNDNRIDNALDAVYTYMSDENYYEGTSDYISIIKNYAYKGLPSSNDEKSLLKSILMSIGIGAIITAVIMGILIAKNRMVRKKTTAKENLDRNNMNIENISDILISSHTSKVKIEHSSSSGGGSSTHSGSSGGSHGGGGHSF